ncbi:uncharacterized protein CCR75_005083 [Bremia lactucae]|uniref:FYVE-type domain-containing protein n=1 Tax=Bremia lactucae TaxID=4779 RepID=A0A976IM61_BRELC|nr:hypothetical protein CCR75_005082 [Bremia lactucae]TDH74385.1 hypothetical protein CCR75_005083 [Bremia lactucae]
MGVQHLVRTTATALLPKNLVAFSKVSTCNQKASLEIVALISHVFMKFPLPSDTFPTLSLPQTDQDALKHLAQAFVDDAIVDYRTFRSPQLKGHVDESNWKFIKKRDGLSSYWDRKLLERELGGPASLRNSVPEKLGSMWFTRNLHGVLTVGTIPGSLHDLMYGMHHYSMELMRIKSAYMADTIVDGTILSHIDSATVDHPVYGLYIKWSVSEFPNVLRCLMRTRDFVFLHTTGILIDERTGDEIGYSVMHSLEIPGIRELTELQIVRGTLSACALFRQQSPAIVEVYLKGFVDPRGDMPASVAIRGTAEALMSYRKATYCGQMKKLNWLLTTKKTIMLDEPSGVCIGCHKPVKKTTSRDRQCQVCMNQVCRSCCQVHRLAFLSSTRRIVYRNLVFCAHCLRVAGSADGLDIALAELRRRNPLEFFETSSNGSLSVSPSRSTLPDIQQEFFG